MFGASADRRLKQACATDVVHLMLAGTTFASVDWNAARGCGCIPTTLPNQLLPTLTAITFICH